MAQYKINRPYFSSSFPPQDFRKILKLNVPLTILVAETSKFRETVLPQHFPTVSSFSNFLNNRNPFTIRDFVLDSFSGPLSIYNHEFTINFVDCTDKTILSPYLSQTPLDMICDYWSSHTTAPLSFFGTRLLMLTIACSTDSEADISKCTEKMESETKYPNHLLSPIKLLITIKTGNVEAMNYSRYKNTFAFEKSDNFEFQFSKFLGSDFSAILQQQIKSHSQLLNEQYKTQKKKGFMKIFTGNNVQKVESLKGLNCQAIYAIEKYMADILLFFSFCENSYTLYRTIISEYKNLLPSLIIANVYELQALSGLLARISDNDTIERLEKAYSLYSTQSTFQRLHIRLLVAILMGLSNPEKANVYIKSTETQTPFSPIFSELSAYYFWDAAKYRLATIEFIKSFIQWYDLSIIKRAEECLEAIICMEDVLDPIVVANCRLLKSVVTNGQEHDGLRLVSYFILYNSSTTSYSAPGIIAGPTESDFVFSDHIGIPSNLNRKLAKRIDAKLMQYSIATSSISHTNLLDIFREGDSVSIQACIKNDFLINLSLTSIHASVRVKRADGSNFIQYSEPLTLSIPAKHKVLLNFCFPCIDNAVEITPHDIVYKLTINEIISDSDFFNVTIPEIITSEAFCEPLHSDDKLIKRLNRGGIDVFIPQVLSSDGIPGRPSYSVAIDNNYLYETEMSKGRLIFNNFKIDPSSYIDVKATIPIYWMCEAESDRNPSKKRLFFNEETSSVEFTFLTSSENFFILELTNSIDSVSVAIVTSFQTKPITYPYAKWAKFPHLNNLSLVTTYTQHTGHDFVHEKLITNTEDFQLQSYSENYDCLTDSNWVCVAKFRFSKHDENRSQLQDDPEHILFKELHTYGCEFRMRSATTLAPTSSKSEDMAFISSDQRKSPTLQKNSDHTRFSHYGLLFSFENRKLLVPGILPFLKTNQQIFFSIADAERIEKVMEPVTRTLTFYNMSGRNRKLTIWLNDTHRNYIWLGPTRISFRIDEIYTLNIGVLFYQTGIYSMNGLRVFLDGIEVKRLKSLTITVLD